MLFGTYQAYPVDENEKDCNSLTKAYRKIDETIGFAPIYAFPIKSLEDFFAQSNMVTTDGLNILIMVETDDFLRVDKVAFEKDLFFKKVNKGLKNYVNDNLPDELTAFVLKPEVFNNITFAIEVAGTAAFAVNEASFFEALDESYGWNEALSGISADFFKASFEMYVRNKAKDIIEKTFSDFQEDSDSEEITETMCDVACKRVLEEIFLPFVYHAVDEEAPNHYAVEACSNTSVALSHTRRHFLDWMKSEDTSKEKYMQFYNEFKGMPVLSESLQEALFLHEKISRNEPCPCGSGKKYKNCHGRILD